MTCYRAKLPAAFALIACLVCAGSSSAPYLDTTFGKSQLSEPDSSGCKWAFRTRDARVTTFYTYPEPRPGAAAGIHQVAAELSRAKNSASEKRMSSM